MSVSSQPMCRGSATGGPAARTPAWGIAVGALFCVSLVVLWSGVTLSFDSLWISGFVRQIEANHYPRVGGRILDSTVERHTDLDNGTTYTARLRYAYRVDGHEYIGIRIRYGMSVSGPRAARAEVAEHPAGSSTLVYYNAINPNDALLSPGVGGPDLFLPMFLTPFNIIMLTLWTGVARWIGRRRRSAAEAGGVPIRVRGRAVHVRMPRITPVGAFTLTLLGSTFAMTFIVAFGSRGTPSNGEVLLAWSAVLGVTALVTLKVGVPIWQGKRDLVLDPVARRLTLPQTFGRTEPIDLIFSDVLSAKVDDQQSTDSEGHVHHAYLVTLHHCPTVESGDSIATLAKWRDPTAAAVFVHWLQEKLGLHAEKVNPKPTASPATSTR
jgi:hypothetical protein